MSNTASSPATPDVLEDDAKELNERRIAGKAADKVDDHVPVDPKPDNDPLDPTAHTDRLSTIEESVGALATSVKVLTDLIGDGVKDSSPRDKSVPWTHIGSRRD